MFHIIVLLYENNNGCKTQCKSITFKVFGPTSLGRHVWKGKLGISTLLQLHFIEACPVADKHSQSVNHKHYNISPVLLCWLKTKKCICIGSGRLSYWPLPFLSDPGKPGVRSLGPDVTPTPCVDLTDVTLADEDTNSILTDTAQRLSSIRM